ncbi:polysaccharide deacetylase family protein [Pseudarthrobacter sp. NPDC080039]|uniref:polysaccharide deacetylase family protein n=1 Tax=unclassified Pseudarthrobacter TaxID=2647000 RepID=UPI00344D3920
MDETPRHLTPGTATPNRRTVMLAAAMSVMAAFPDQAVQFSTNRVLGPTPTSAAGNDSNAAVDTNSAPQPPAHSVQDRPLPPPKNDTINTYTGRTPRYWGLEAPGVLTKLPQGTAGIAVTIDFCGGPGGNGYDRTLIAALRARRIPATLFLNSRWITANTGTARELAAEPLFELANHGTTHRPLSTTGNSAYGITGTRTVAEVYDEVMTNDALLTEMTGSRPRYFRPGTAYLDDVAATIVSSLGVSAVGFSINADGGATYPAATVTTETAKAKPGDIILCHGNHSGGGTADGLVRALDKLATNGTPFLPLP